MGQAEGGAELVAEVGWVESVVGLAVVAATAAMVVTGVAQRAAVAHEVL